MEQTLEAHGSAPNVSDPLKHQMEPGWQQLEARELASFHQSC